MSQPEANTPSQTDKNTNNIDENNTITEKDIDWNMFFKHERGIANMGLGGAKSLGEYKANTLKYIEETYGGPPHSKR